MRKHLALLAVCALAAGPAVAQVPKSLASSPKLAKAGETNVNYVKMSSDLLEARGLVKSGAKASDAIDAKLAHSKRNGRLQVILGCNDIEAAAEACKDAGLDIVHVLDQFGAKAITVQCDSPLDLDPLIDVDAVQLVLSEGIPVTMAGSVAGQANKALNVDDANVNYPGVDGSGIRVGVLSDSFNDVGATGSASGDFWTGTDSQTSGDLPASIRLLDAGPGGGTDEGRAMMELIYDVAPGCDLSFASAFTGYTAFATNISALATDTYPCDVIVDDVIYFEEPMYQDGPIAQAYEDAFANQDVACFSSAGNFYKSAHELPYSDINSGTDDTATLPSGYDLHNFGGGDTHLEISLPDNAGVTVALHWDEPYDSGFGEGPGSEADLDLYLVDSTATPVLIGMVKAGSANVQGTSGSPFGNAIESFSYQNTSGGTETLYLIVEHYDGIDPTRVHLLINISGGTITDSALLGDRTLFGHAAAANVMGVAASFYGDIQLGGGVTPTAAVDPEPFTALGGSLPFLYDNAGADLAPAQFRDKPDFTAPDGSNNTFFGNDNGGAPPESAFWMSIDENDTHPNFFGTSAAAPHAAAVAALVRQHVPAASATEVYTGLIGTAVDIDAGPGDETGPGYDYRTGFGYIDADLALGATLPVELDLFEID